MIRQEASKKWWYRLIKVLFILYFISSLFIPVTVFLNNKPEIDSYKSRFSLKCNDGRMRGDFDGTDLNSSLTGFSYYAQDNPASFARIACAYKESGEDFVNLIKSRNYIDPKETNYKIVITKSVYDSSWFITIGYTFIATLGTIIFFSLIRALFFYIIFGNNFWKNLIWKKDV
jgi:hypothetical protein